MKTISHYKNAIRNRANKFINERRGWKTDRHIVVIESDDWGSVRMPSMEILSSLQSKGLKFALEMGYDKYDTIESNDDLELLMGVLDSYRDKNNNPCVINLNYVVANPDFEMIASKNYSEYNYELIVKTFQKYPKRDRVLELVHEGVKKQLFLPQFHGREHLNVPMWMNMLKNGDKHTLNAFEYGVFSLLLDKKNDYNASHFLQAYNVASDEDMEYVKKNLVEGLELFEKIFGFKSESMIAPCYTWDDFVEATVSKHNVKYIQGSFTQLNSFYNKFNNKYNYTGKVNTYDQIYLVRNCLFEPSQNKRYNAEFCFKQIERNFNLKKPAIISSHRLNFIGGLSVSNRDDNLQELKKLLRLITEKYSDVEFLSTSELGSVIFNDITYGK